MLQRPKTYVEQKKGDNKTSDNNSTLFSLFLLYRTFRKSSSIFRKKCFFFGFLGNVTKLYEIFKEFYTIFSISSHASA